MSQVVKDLNDVNISDVKPNETKIIMNQPKQDNNILSDMDGLTLDEIEELLKSFKNEFIIINITDIKEKELKELTKEFVNQLYFNQNLDKIFEIFKPDWLKEYIEKQNIDSKKLLEMMLNHDQSNDYFASYIGYFYQNGIGTEVNNQKSLAYYLQITNMQLITEMENNSLEIINQSIGQYFLAILYRHGIIVTRDLEKMFEWGIKSAQLGNIIAQISIGDCYKIGYGTTKDRKKAFEWYLKSAKQKNSEGQFNVAKCYRDGMGIEKNEQKAFKWFLKSAKNGNIGSQYKVAICFKNGKCTKKDINKANEWFQKSLDNGNKNAARKFSRNLKWKNNFDVCKTS